MRPFLVGLLLVGLMACQSTPEPYDPSSIYQIPETALESHYDSHHLAEVMAIANRDVVAIDSLPHSLNFFRFNQPNSRLSARWMAAKGAIVWGEFRLNYANYSDLVLLSFDTTGQLLDQLWVHYLEQQNNQWTRFYSNYYYTPDSDVVIEALDTTITTTHPHEGTALKHWRWSPDPQTGQFDVLIIEVEDIAQ